MTLREILTKKVFILDGLMTESFQKAGYTHFPDQIMLNINCPSIVAGFHQNCLKSGTNIITANTAGAIRPHLAEYHLENEIGRINASGVEIARQVAGESAFVAGHVQTCSLKIEPDGEMSFDEAVGCYIEQIDVLIKSGIDLLIIDSMHDLQELRAAVIAANSLRSAIPLIVFGIFNDSAKTCDGMTIESFITIMEGLQADIIGLNQPVSVKQMTQNLNRFSGKPTAIKFFQANPENMAKTAEFLIGQGVSVIGGTENATPDHIRAISNAIRNKEFVRVSQQLPLRISSRSQTVKIGSGLPFVKIGERINPTGRKALSASLTEKRYDLVLKEAADQFENGAHALDVNVGVPMIDEPATMKTIVSQIQKTVPLPLVLDSASPTVIEAGLKVYAGKALVNSVNGKPKQLEELLPIVKKYGAAVIALTIDESIPETAEKRLAIAKLILKTCESFGIPKENIIIDAAAMAVATSENSGPEILKAVRLIKDELNLPVSLGVSNTSFGLPERALVHNTFLIQAMAMGLDAAILNPLDQTIHLQIAAASLFVGRDPNCMNYIKIIRSRKSVE